MNYRLRSFILFGILIITAFPLTLAAQGEVNQGGYGLRGSLDKRSLWAEINYSYTVHHYFYVLAGGIYQKTVFDLPNTFTGVSTDGRIKWQSKNTSSDIFMLKGALGLTLPLSEGEERQWRINLEPGILIQPFSYALNTIECKEDNPNDPNTIIVWNEPVKEGFKLGYIFWNIDLSIQYQRENTAYSIGYGISSQDPYKTLRKTVYRGTEIQKFITDNRSFIGHFFIEIRKYF